MKKIFTLLFVIGFTIFSNAQKHEILSYFKGTVNKNEVVLNWAVKEGRTCYGIHIYHSTDDINYKEIGEIKGICGSVTEEIHYTLIDSFPVSNENNFYKLELGLQGSSTPLILDFQKINREGYSLFPNPGTDRFQLFIEGTGEPVELNVIDITGKTVANIKLNSGNLETIETADWNSGVYMFQIIKNGEVRAVPRWIKTN